MKLVQKENKLRTNNGQFVPRPSSLTRLSERFHKNETRSFKLRSFFEQMRHPRSFSTIVSKWR